MADFGENQCFLIFYTPHPFYWDKPDTPSEASCNGQHGRENHLRLSLLRRTGGGENWGFGLECGPGGRGPGSGGSGPRTRTPPTPPLQTGFGHFPLPLFYQKRCAAEVFTVVWAVARCFRWCVWLVAI